MFDTRISMVGLFRRRACVFIVASCVTIAVVAFLLLRIISVAGGKSAWWRVDVASVSCVLM